MLVSSARTNVPMPFGHAQPWLSLTLTCRRTAWSLRTCRAITGMCLTLITITSPILTLTCRLTFQVDLRPASSPQAARQSGLRAAPWDCSSTVGLTVASYGCAIMGFASGGPL